MQQLGFIPPIALSDERISLQVWEAFADMVAARLEKRLYPAKDEITVRTAWGTYGRRWIETHRQSGKLKGHRKGAYRNSPIMLSRVDIEALRNEEINPLRMRNHKTRGYDS